MLHLYMDNIESRSVGQIKLHIPDLPLASSMVKTIDVPAAKFACQLYEDGPDGGCRVMTFPPGIYPFS
jgi:hypothetical protein